MRRAQIQLDQAMHATLRRLAYERGTSISSIIRDTLTESLGKPSGKRRRAPRSVEEFPFVGAGRSDQKKHAPVSERHDEALAETLVKKTR